VPGVGEANISGKGNVERRAYGNVCVVLEEQHERRYVYLCNLLITVEGHSRK
jgi:hypothetical protein